VDADTLRQRWPEILDEVRSKGKVAWMLLNTASVQELESGVLTIAFPSGGNARGFASSRYDQVLVDALAAMLGLNVRVRAVAGDPPAPTGCSGPASGHGTAGERTPAGHGSPSGSVGTDLAATDQPTTGAQAQDTPASGRPAHDPPASRRSAQDPPASRRSAQDPAGSGPGASGRPDTDRPSSARRAAGRSSTARAAGSARASEPEASTPRAAAPGNGRRERPDTTSTEPPAGSSGAGQAQPARSRNAPPPRAAAFAEEEWPDDATGPGAADKLSGMELIQQQLGGTVIEEIEDT
jgi:hypothetical protein